MIHFKELIQIRTQGKSLHEITKNIEKVIEKSKINSGLCNLFILHTSASLLIQENADQNVQRDLEYFFGKLVPENDTRYLHTTEGTDDMPSHIRSAITKTSENIPIEKGKMLLGTWQGVFLWEHRVKSHLREIVINIFGE